MPTPTLSDTPLLKVYAHLDNPFINQKFLSVDTDKLPNKCVHLGRHYNTTNPVLGGQTSGIAAPIMTNSYNSRFYTYLHCAGPWIIAMDILPIIYGYPTYNSILTIIGRISIEISMDGYRVLVLSMDIVDIHFNVELLKIFKTVR